MDGLHNHPKLLQVMEDADASLIQTSLFPINSSVRYWTIGQKQLDLHMIIYNPDSEVLFHLFQNDLYNMYRPVSWVLSKKFVLCSFLPGQVYS